MKSILTILILCLNILSCNVPKNQKAETKNYSDIEIYCFCFLSEKPAENKNDRQRRAVICNTPFRYTPFNLIEHGNLLYHTNDSLTIHSLANIVFASVAVEKTAPVFEARLLILLKKNNVSADTVAYIDNKNFYHNNGKTFQYSFDVLDSIKKVINMDEIDCTTTSLLGKSKN